MRYVIAKRNVSKNQIINSSFDLISDLKMPISEIKCSKGNKRKGKENEKENKENCTTTSACARVRDDFENQDLENRENTTTRSEEASSSSNEESQAPLDESTEPAVFAPVYYSA